MRAEAFQPWGGNICNGLARWDGSLWHPVASFLNNFQMPGVYNLYTDNNDLFVLGGFSSVDAIPAHGIAKYNGTSWLTFPTLDSTGIIADAIIYNGELYVGGNFNGGNNLKDIAKFDGLNWVPVGNGLSGSNSWVNSFEIFQGMLYVAGYFHSNNGDPGNGVALWDGTGWSQAGTGLLPSNVHDLIEFNNELYAGGQINNAGGISVHFIAKWDGNLWSALPTNPVFDNAILCFAASPMSIYMGGGFNTVNNLIANNIVEYNNIVSVEELSENKNVKVFPNPFKEFVTFTLLDFENYILPIKFELVNSIGIKIMDKLVSENEFIVKKSTLKSGIYFYKLYNEKFTYNSGKIVIE